MISEEELSRIITTWVMENGQKRDSPGVDEQVDLLASGALDSMGFIELLAHIESVTGQKIDLPSLDPSSFTSINGLVRNVVATRTYV